MCVLALFNQKDVWTFKEIQEKTRIAPEQLAQSILVLAHPKNNILLKRPNTNTIGDDHRFKFNNDYTGGDRSLIKTPQRRCDAEQQEIVAEEAEIDSAQDAAAAP